MTAIMRAMRKAVDLSVQPIVGQPLLGACCSINVDPLHYVVETWDPAPEEVTEVTVMLVNMAVRAEECTKETLHTTMLYVNHVQILVESGGFSAPDLC